MMPPVQPTMPVQPKKDRTAGAVVGCLVVFALGIGGVAAGAVYFMRGRVGPSAPDGPITRPEPLVVTGGPPAAATPLAPARGTPAPTVGFSGDLEWERPVETANLAKVDIQDLFAQARPMAEKLQPGAQFVGLVGFDIVGGVADLTGESRVSFDFEFAGTDPSQPPGKDSVEFRIDVDAKKGMLHARRMKWPASHLKHMGGALEPPGCQSAKAWATATSSGVPANAVATIHYYSNTPFAKKATEVWSVRVEGHDEYRRELDGKTCGMVRNWGKK